MNAKMFLRAIIAEKNDQSPLAELVKPAVNNSAMLNVDQQEFVRRSLFLGMHIEKLQERSFDRDRLFAALSIATYINSCKPSS